MRGNRLYGSEGGGAVSRSPYPYRLGEWDARRYDFRALWGCDLARKTVLTEARQCL
jgi:hypothetical protein